MLLLTLLKLSALASLFLPACAGSEKVPTGLYALYGAVDEMDGTSLIPATPPNVCLTAGDYSESSQQAGWLIEGNPLRADLLAETCQPTLTSLLGAWTVCKDSNVIGGANVGGAFTNFFPSDTKYASVSFTRIDDTTGLVYVHISH